MGKRASRSARTRALLGAAVALATAAGWHPALAAVPPPPTVVIDDGGDGWISPPEAAAVTISGTYDLLATPPVTSIIARIVNSETCDNAAAQATAAVTFPVAGDGTFVSPPFDVSAFSDGAVLCARARTINADGQSDVAFSSNLPVLDLTAPAAPTIVNPLENAIVGAHPRISGTLKPPVQTGTTVEILDVTTAVTRRIGVGPVHTTGGWSVPVFFEFSGPRLVRAQAVDGAGNVGPLSAIRALDVDASAPTVTIELPADNTVYLPDVPVEIEGRADDRGFGILALEVHVFNMGSMIETHHIKDFTCVVGCPTNLRVSWEYTPPAGFGYFTAKIWAIDVAGNRSPQPAQVSFLKLS